MSGITGIFWGGGGGVCNGKTASRTVPHLDLLSFFPQHMQRSLVALLRILVHVAGKPALNGTLTSQSLYISQWKCEKNLKKGNNDSKCIKRTFKKRTIMTVTHQSVERHKKNLKRTIMTATHQSLEMREKNLEKGQ